jgi:hypothetical protein
MLPRPGLYKTSGHPLYDRKPGFFVVTPARLCDRHVHLKLIVAQTTDHSLISEFVLASGRALLTSCICTRQIRMYRMDLTLVVPRIIPCKCACNCRRIVDISSCRDLDLPFSLSDDFRSSHNKRYAHDSCCDVPQRQARICESNVPINDGHACTPTNSSKPTRSAFPR